MKQADRNKTLDAAFRTALQKDGAKAAANPWFTPRVMNRLPEAQPRHRCPLAEIVCYLLGCFGLLGGWGYAVISILGGNITYTTLGMAVLLPLVGLFCLCVLSAPVIRRALE